MDAPKLVLVGMFACVCTFATRRAHAESPPPAIGVKAAAELLFGGSAAPASCADVDCLIASRYADDDQARALALQLHRTTGDVAGVGFDEVVDGGYRGMVHLVPQLPIGRYRQHLAWVVTATGTIDAFFAALFADHPAPPFRWRALAFGFMRSVGRHTPSAYATPWGIAYNVDGSMVTSAASVAETLVHELFHDNDEAHDGWSMRTLQADYDAILARCGAHPRASCLAPYAPGANIVSGGTYYAFQQHNGAAVREYGAELAVRYFTEQTEMLHRGKLGHRAFKCGPAENARAWQAIISEFFGGRDLVPACA